MNPLITFALFVLTTVAELLSGYRGQLMTRKSCAKCPRQQQNDGTGAARDIVRMVIWVSVHGQSMVPIVTMIRTWSSAAQGQLRFTSTAFGEDSTASGVAELAPLTNFGSRAETPDTQVRLAVELADVDAR